MSMNLNFFAKITISQLASRINEHENYVNAALEQENLYRSPSGYLQWNTHIRTCFMSGAAEVAIAGYKNQDVLCVKVGELAREAIFEKAPARYISKEL